METIYAACSVVLLIVSYSYYWVLYKEKDEE